jgi:hypothetical protein
MCLVCIEYAKQKLTIEEGIRNITEMKQEVGEEHFLEVYNQLHDDLVDRNLEEYWSHYYEQVGFSD